MRIYKRGSTYYLDYSTPSGKRIRRPAGQTKKLAETALAKIRVQIAEGRYLDKVTKPEEVSLAKAAEEFLIWSRSNKRSHARDELCVRHLKRHLGNPLLGGISPLDVERYKRARTAEGVKGRTVNIELACLRNLFNKAIQWGHAESNPVTGVKKFKEDNGRVRFLTVDEIRRLLDACPDNVRPIVVLALNTGMRKGEIMALRWDDVDLCQGLLTVRHSKSGYGRKVPMTETVRGLLLLLKKQGDGEHLFYTALGGKRPLNCFRSAWENALKRAGIKDFRFHDLRHTAASHLVMASVDIKAVQEILGHRTLAMTMRYAHLSPEHRARAIKVLDTVFAPVESHIEGSCHKSGTKGSTHSDIDTGEWSVYIGSH